MTSCALFVFCISWNFACDISTVFEEIKHLRSSAPDNIYKIIKINKTQLLLKYFFVHEVLNFLKNNGKMFKYYKRSDDVLMFEKQYFP
jgi:hypothetical protein